MIPGWLDWTGRPESEYWSATPAEVVRAVKSGRRRRALRYRDMAFAARLGQSAEKNLERYLPPIEDD